MADRRRDREIEVFALDGDTPDATGPGANGTGATGPGATDPGATDPGATDRNATGPNAPGTGATGQNASRSGFGADPTVDAVDTDEVRQGASGGLSRYPLRARIPLGHRRAMAPAHLAGVVAALVVVAFVAGLVIGRGTATRRTTGTPVRGGVVYGSGEFGSVLPTASTIRVSVSVVPDPLPSGTAGPKGTVAASDVYALQLAAKPVNTPGQSVDYQDAGALSGPWSLIVRRRDGSLGRHSSVLTYPVGRPVVAAGTKHVRVGAVTGYLDAYGGIVWPIAGRWARIRGDLGAATLTAVAARVTLRHQRPVLTHPPAGLHVAATLPYRASVVAESRYSNSLRLDSGPVDGLVFADVGRCGSFEEALYVEGSDPAGIIGGHPAVTSPVGGGNASVAWEPRPGTIVLVGYSGTLAASASTAALVDLTRAGRLLDRRQWLAGRPASVPNTNVYS